MFHLRLLADLLFQIAHSDPLLHEVSEFLPVMRNVFAFLVLIPLLLPKYLVYLAQLVLYGIVLYRYHQTDNK